MNTKFVVASILFVLAVVLETVAAIKFLGFPDVSMLKMSVLCSVSGAITFVISVRLYRSIKRNNTSPTAAHFVAREDE
ncbi:hypothetical protein KDA_31920 [Dictyobacter alpinus]|uniref:Uncharacterized protein n=1 Tax=Dictyobacter alpinus TaxID=2014873 RepID=A0A402B8M1_9CHLR|nr:hypothetical protein [Dictyobacter alpinus]GCE27708.1 hypothetical protein KDA_31920 [Dictyobacter alpinus]